MTSLVQLTQLPDDSTYTEHEKNIVSKWIKIDLYEQMTEKKDETQKIIIMDGPPFVSGSLHPGHITVSSIKSAIFNYKSMKGFNASFKMGYDCHGLPIENLVCKENNITSLNEIHAMGLEKFNKICDETIQKYSKSWTPLFQHIGRLADFGNQDGDRSSQNGLMGENVYMTRDLKFMESCIWIFNKLWKDGHVYKGNKVMAYSYACQTPLSNFEASQNYKEIETKSIYVAFKTHSGEHLVAWTTTPWTLPCNMGLCINSAIDYVKVIKIDDPNKQVYILSKKSADSLFGKEKYTIIEELKGKALVGVKYYPIFPYIDNIDNINDMNDEINSGLDPKPCREYQVWEDGYVKDEETGTGIVHLAPAFGEDDFRVLNINAIVNNINISKYCPLDADGKYTSIIADYQGKLVFDCDDLIRSHLKSRGILLKTQLIKHQYPHCYRTDTPLIYRTTESYFIKVSEMRDNLVRLNKTINWYPKNIGENRFHNWLSSTKDWAVSRYRFYGTPIPVWESDDGDSICIGSIEELALFANIPKESITNLHPEFINHIIINKNGKTYKRNSAIFDCWFESGAVPFAQIHYPFDEKAARELESREYLSDFICEGMDQTRGWFYTLLVLSSAILNKAPFKNVMCTGMVLDSDGNKYSKRSGNYQDPSIIIHKYGADYIRTYFIHSPLIHAEPLKFDEEMIKKLKQKFIPYINGVKFWLEHAMNYQRKGFHVAMLNANVLGDNIMDHWILNRINEIIKSVNLDMEQYALGSAIDTLINFIDDLTNWYIKFNRDRLKGHEGNQDWGQSISILHHVLMIYCRLWVPFTPFISEHIFQHLKVCSTEYMTFQSVLLTSYPEHSTDYKDTSFMKDLQKICQIVRNLRDKTKNHSRAVIPLKSITIYHDNITYLKTLEKNINVIQGELNCNEFKFEKLGNNIKIKATVDRKNIGQHFKGHAKTVVNHIENWSDDDMLNIYCCNGLSHNIVLDGINHSLDNRFYKLYPVPKNTNNSMTTIDDDIMISIDDTYDDEINYQYQLKRLHSLVQLSRKEMGLRPWNSISVVIDNDYANDKTKDDLHKILTNTDIHIGIYEECDKTTGISETPIHILMTNQFIWEHFDKTCVNGYMSVYAKK